MVGYLLAGLVVAVLARAVKKGKRDLHLVATVPLGLIGSLTGAYVAGYFEGREFVDHSPLGLALAVCTAVLAVWVGEDAAATWRQSRNHGLHQ